MNSAVHFLFAICLMAAVMGVTYRDASYVNVIYHIYSFSFEHTNKFENEQIKRKSMTKLFIMDYIIYK